ncbi:MAG: helix-turn-helix domain-containing protein [Candidatus Pacearchaeota archaeon]|jgi:DNA-binding transcriptional ArsR family regulator
MANKFIMIDLNDEKSKNIANVLSNKTCKKILKVLSEVKELSEKDISDKLKLPINTIEYNLKKLLVSGLIEKTKNFFWSKKGKKIDLYRISNKSIVISPKTKKLNSKIKSFLGVGVISVIASLGVRQYFLIKQKNLLVSQDAMYSVTEKSLQTAGEMAARASEGAGNLINFQIPVFWIWFLAGAIFALLILSIIKLKGGKK